MIVFGIEEYAKKTHHFSPQYSKWVQILLKSIKISSDQHSKSSYMNISPINEFKILAYKGIIKLSYKLTQHKDILLSERESLNYIFKLL